MAAGAQSTEPVHEAELLPELFRVADLASRRGQRHSITLARWQLLLLTAGAAVGSLAGRPYAWVAAAAYLGAGGLAALVSRQNPQGLWYEGRAAAESVKTLAWKFAVRADAYQPLAATLPDAEGLYDLQLRGILRGFRDSPVLPGDAERRAGVTAAMRELRAQPLTVRREVYLRERVAVQHDWYQAKAGYCDRAGRTTELLGVALPVLGLVLAVLRALGAVSFDQLGTVSAVAASVTAWAQLRQYRPLAAAYRLAADELELVRAQLTQLDLSAADSEEVWARLARDAEDAVSREHTTWQARREVRGPGH
ncbi:DUF4231 domain-containing protein [Kitasatospora sp. NBC_01250]|uniref:DUF4231 domain-containing protein n=1 Tax=unclassified Kitasatospora TaxID=2633591 RepID=UPI002E1587DB|nr:MULTISPECIES: DUF4231 domain-containing protein [unclassified Kitasatospora]WSJ68717.1 DUF4231 domain-containing protein [Kitasatospora sp. NBC_01302]